MNNVNKYKEAMKELLADDTVMLTYLAKKYHFSRGSFSTYLKKNGYEIKRRGKSTETERKQKDAISMYSKGMSIKHISKELNLSRKSLGLYFKNKNIKLRKERVLPLKNYSKNNEYFKSIDSEEKAYWIGFIMADGCVRDTNQTGRLTLEIGIVDINHLKKFRKCIESNAPIRKRKNRDTCTLNISSKEIVNDLITLGCNVNKTVNGYFNPTCLETDMEKRAFLRGYLDGDGYIDKGNKWRIIFTVKSKLLVNTLLEILNGYNIHTKLYDKKSYYRINIERKKDFIELLNLLYADATIYLDRKFQIYILRTQPFQEETLERISAELNGEDLPDMYEHIDNILG